MEAEISSILENIPSDMHFVREAVSKGNIEALVSEVSSITNILTSGTGLSREAVDDLCYSRKLIKFAIRDLGGTKYENI